jgi:hypothetical protein
MFMLPYLCCGLPGLVEKGIDFNVTRNAFIKKHESILQRSQDNLFQQPLPACTTTSSPFEIPHVEGKQNCGSEENNDEEDIPDCLYNRLKNAELVTAERAHHTVLADKILAFRAFLHF